jgi:hypothetical protein
MSKSTIKIKIDDEELVNVMYHLSMLQSYKNALWELSHNLYSRVKYKENLTVSEVLTEVNKIIEEEGIDINRLDS